MKTSFFDEMHLGEPLTEKIHLRLVQAANAEIEAELPSNSPATTRHNRTASKKAAVAHDDQHSPVGAA